MLTRATAETQFVSANRAHTVTSALPVLCFAGALVTDVAYWRTSEIQWANFSAWLLAIGMVLGGVSLIVEFVHLMRAPSRDRPVSGWLGIAVMAVALAVGLVNNFIHARDGWTSVVPSGLILSAVTVALMIAASIICAHSDRARIGASHE